MTDLITRGLDEAGLNHLEAMILGSYHSTTRSYHGIEHIWRLLSDFEDMCEFFGFDAMQRKIILNLIFWHDFRMVFGAKDNERKSAEAYLAAGDESLEDEFTRRVYYGILDTKDHVSPSSWESACFMDLDLATLGGPWEQFDLDAMKIQREYVDFGDEAWNSGRTAFMGAMLKRRTIYHTAWGAQREAQARDNLTRSLSEIGRNS